MADIDARKAVQLLIIAVFSAALLGFLWLFFGNTTKETAAAIPAVHAVKPDASAVQKKTEAAVKPAPRQIKTEEDIRQEYGRLEVVTLSDGKLYRGAVVSVGEEYTMVTAGGIVKIPMTDIRARDIIR